MQPYLADPDVVLLHGDVLDRLRELPDESVDCVITSPPYWGLRDYGTGTWEGGSQDCDHRSEAKPRKFTNGRGEGIDDGYAGSNLTSWTYRDATPRDACGKCGARRVDNQLGLEPTPDLYVARMVEVFREVRRVLAGHGTCWVNMGDGYNADHKQRERPNMGLNVRNARTHENRVAPDLKPKDLVGMPWRLAFALQADGWYLRSDIIWSKPNPMPESVTDRPTKAHEYVFLLTKSPRYWFDQEAVRETAEWRRWGDQTYSPEAEAMYGQRIKPRTKAELTPRNDGERWNEADGRGFVPNQAGRNIRSVWEMPENLVRLRGDLSEADRSYVLAELMKRGL